jgi:hypothetical protein
MTEHRFLVLIAVCAVALLAGGWLLPSWSFVINVAIAKAIAVLGHRGRARNDARVRELIIGESHGPAAAGGRADA